MAYAYALNPADPLGTDQVKFGWQHIANLESAVRERLGSFFADVDNDPLQVKTGARFLGTAQVDGLLTLGAALTVAAGVTIPAGPVLIGGDPGGAETLRVGGSTRLSGYTTVGTVHSLLGTSVGGTPHIWFDTAGAVPRFAFGLGDGEGGANSGANLYIWRYPDAGGSPLGYLKFGRSDGALSVSSLILGTDPGGADLLRVGGGARLGGGLIIGGGVQVQRWMTALPTWNPSSAVLSPGQSVSTTVTVTGAAIDDQVMVENLWGGGSSLHGSVTSADTVTLYLTNIGVAGGLSWTPPSKTFRVFVVKF